MSFSDYWEDEILDHVFGKGTYTPPTIYVGLSTADPTDAGTGVSEPSAGSYARVETASADWTLSAGGVIENAVDIEFPAPTGNWGTLTHGVLFDAASGGNVLASCALADAQYVESGATAPVVLAGSLTVSLT